MLSIDAAVAQLTKLIKPITEYESVALTEAANRILARDVLAPISLPPFNSSAMDGYALRAEDIKGKERNFRVVGTSFAGRPFEGDYAHQGTVRIFTGAAVPAWANAVVLQEDVERCGNDIKIFEAIHPGDNIRFIGSDIAQNEVLCQQGTQLDAFSVSWLAACGLSSVMVSPRIRVALFSTGDELQDPGQPLTYGRIYDSNRIALHELLKLKPTVITDLGRLPDDPQAIEAAIRRVSNDVDLVLTSGGVSVGDADYVRPVIEKLGKLTFWKVALKPGKPIAVGRVDSALFLGLPGNPVSAVVTYLLFVAHAIDAFSGKQTVSPLAFPAKLTQSVYHSEGRREFQRGIVRRVGNALHVEPTGDQSSNRLATLATANCFIVVPETEGSIPAGRVVDVLLLPREAQHLVNGPA